MQLSKKVRIFLLIPFILFINSPVFSEHVFGLYYGQSNVNMFLLGVSQQFNAQKLPISQFTQIGYVYDTRNRAEYKGDGHGITLEFILSLYASIHTIKLGGYTSLFGLIEAYNRKDIDALWRERDFGYSTGLYAQFLKRINVRIGVLRAYELSKFVFLSYKYPFAFYFSISTNIL